MTTNKEAKGPYTISSTGPENKYYKYEDYKYKDYKYEGNCQQFGQSTSGFWDVDDKYSDNSATACTEKPEEVKASDIPYEDYMKIVHENELLKQIIIELNKQLYNNKNNLW